MTPDDMRASAPGGTRAAIPGDARATIPGDARTKAPAAARSQAGARRSNDLAAIARAAQIARVRARYGFTTADYRRELRRTMRVRAVRRFFLTLLFFIIALVAAYVALRSADIVNSLL